MLAMAIFDQEGTDRPIYTRDTLRSLLDTVDFRKHRIFLIDNNSCDLTKKFLAEFAGNFSSIGPFPEQNLTIIHNQENLGTAKAINQALKHREPGENCIKMDNDVVIHYPGWIEEMEEALARLPKIGILGLKRNDLIESPLHPDPTWRSVIYQLPHEPGQRWIYFERVRGVMGTCTMYNHRLLDKIGFLYQPTIYGYDDSLISTRSEVAGFVNGFLPYIHIDHIDTGHDGKGKTEYQKWKEDSAVINARTAVEISEAYRDGTRSIYEEAGV